MVVLTSFVNVIFVSVSLYTLYGQLLEDYHRDGRGNDVISTLYKQKIELLKEKKSNGEETSSSKFCGQSIDLELVTKTVEMKRIQGFHEEALNVLAEAYEIADNSKSRFLLLFFSLKIIDVFTPAIPCKFCAHPTSQSISVTTNGHCEIFFSILEVVHPIPRGKSVLSRVVTFVNPYWIIDKFIGMIALFPL